MKNCILLNMQTGVYYKWLKEYFFGRSLNGNLLEEPGVDLYSSPSPGKHSQLLRECTIIAHYSQL